MIQKHLTIIWLALFMGTFVLQAQENPQINIKQILEKATNQQQAKADFQLAEKYYKKGVGTYDEALKHYLKLYELNPNISALNYKIGVCCLYSTKHHQALQYLLNVNSKLPIDYYLLLGEAYQYNKLYDLAEKSFQDYQNTLSPRLRSNYNKDIDLKLRECANGRQLLADSVPVYILNLGSVINSYYDDYGAFVGLNDSLIYFTSRCPEKEPSTVVSRYKFKERILKSNNCINEASFYADNLLPLSKNRNMSLAGLNPLKNELFFYQGKRGNGNIWHLFYNDGKWSTDKPLKGKLNHLAAKETSISVADDGTTFFVSDRRNGLGGKDIYCSKRQPDNKFGKPFNLGGTINTPFDEEAVYVTPNGQTLYFSSNGHAGLGGFDVYKSERKVDGTWGAPVNLGYPINSPADELFYHPTADSMVALYATVRDDSFGGLDIYQIKKDARIPFTLQGKITDIKTGKALPASIQVFNLNDSSIVVNAQQDTTLQHYEIRFADKGFYQIQVSAPEYVVVTDTLDCPKTRHSIINQDYALTRMKHPWTISGVVKDAKTGLPIAAEVFVRLEGADSTIYARQFVEDGHYRFSLDDYYNVNISVQAVAYFSLAEPILAKKLKEKEIVRDFSLTRSKISYVLWGRITEQGTDSGIKATMNFYRPNTTTSILTINSNDSLQGKYQAQLPDKGPFKIEITADGYVFLNETVQYSDTSEVIEKNLSLQKIKAGVKFVMENILFNTGLATLKNSSYPELDKLMKFLAENKEVRIEVSGHTDNAGAASSNKKLSKARALAVKNYLTSKGIEESRIEYEGYGMEQPIADNKTKEGKARNRRVEVKILE